jgi:hypothetical protein
MLNARSPDTTVLAVDEPDFTVTRVGQLVLARVQRLGAPEDVDAYLRSFAPLMADGGARYLCADHRTGTVYTPAVADRLLDIFTGLSRTWARAALVVSLLNATMNRQLTRVIRAAKDPDHRMFPDADGAEAFLRDVLAPDEEARLHAFLSERPTFSR